MCRTPAPPLTALVAASIWSGTGEVNTSPGQAASSIPYPTNPPCRGSWPDPPPDTRPTLRAARPGDHLVLDVHGQRGVRRGDAGQRVDHHGVGGVDEFFHDVLSWILSPSMAAGTGSDGARLVSAASARTRPIATQARPPSTPPISSPMR